MIVGIGNKMVQTKNYGLKTLYIISKIISARSGQREMLLEILDILDSHHNLSRGTVMLLSQDGSELIVEEVNDRDPAMANNPIRQNARYRRGEGITGSVLQSGKPAVIPKISEEPNFRGFIHGKNSVGEEDSFICVPITLENDVIGTLSVFTPYDPDLTLTKEKWLLSVVGSMIANDVKNRRLAKVQREMLEKENELLRNQLQDRFKPENIVGNSKDMRAIYTKIHQVAGADTTVLVCGESGTGKELVASAIHYASNRADKPFVKVNCAALNEHLLESELFGHEKGAFTGAIESRSGRFEEANGGTLFLDEIGDFSPQVQVKLLRVLQEREYQRVGSNKTVPINVRIICATNRDLQEATQNGTFRLDLYYRINVFPIYLPALRKRQNDILLLANHFVEKYAKMMNKEIQRISTTAISMLLAYHWPGNVRELENCIEHAVLLCNDTVIHGYSLPPTLQIPTVGGTMKTGQLKTCVNALEKDMIIDSLKRNAGRISESAKELGITSRMVRYKIEKLGIDYIRLFKKGDFTNVNA